MDEKQITLLAPARDINVAKAAIQAGADAVYIGAPSFGAREKAANSIEDIAELVRYAHPYHVQVLVTLNTLLTPAERKQAVKIAWDCYRAGVDALIIQDLSLLNEDLPPIRLHASTQCDNRTPEQVLYLQSLGFKRVVLARELSLEEIKEISQAVSRSFSPKDGLSAQRSNSDSGLIELEAFIHGALCVSYSGRCFMSERLLGRSANRGCCAQMCRMAYDVLDKNFNEVIDDEGQPLHQRYVLSLQDMDRSLYLKQLIDAGVTTFKIEGRLKDADYVTNIVAYYRQLLDGLNSQLSTEGRNQTASLNSIRLADRALQGRELYTLNLAFSPSPAKTFHRGATDYFMEGRTRPLANWLTPKSTGEKIGVVINHRIVLDEGITLHNGDGLCIGDQGFYYNGNLSASQPNSSPSGGVREGTPVYRNHDTAFLKSLHAERRILVDIVLGETPTGFALTIGEQSATFDYPHEPAHNADQAIQTIRTQLAKLGDTPYEAREIQINLSQPYFIPIATLNQWRRQVTQNL